METLRGIVEIITYFDENSSFSILKIRCKCYSELVTINCNISSVNVGSVLTLKGNWTINPKFSVGSLMLLNGKNHLLQAFMG